MPCQFSGAFTRYVLPKGFHRIRHYGLLASVTCKANIARARELIATPLPPIDPSAERDEKKSETLSASQVCSKYLGKRETFARYKLRNLQGNDMTGWRAII
jgi:hypothetical protein